MPETLSVDPGRHRIHRGCGGDVVGAERVVTARPDELNWPRDRRILVPYCVRCRTLVSFTEVEWAPRS